MGVRTWLVGRGVGVNWFLGSKNGTVRAAAARAAAQRQLNSMGALEAYLSQVSEAQTLSDAMGRMTDHKIIPVNMLSREKVGFRLAWIHISKRFADELGTREGIGAALSGSRYLAGDPHGGPSEAREVRQEILKIASRVAPDLLTAERTYLKGEVASEMKCAGLATARVVLEGLQAEIAFINGLVGKDVLSAVARNPHTPSAAENPDTPESTLRRPAEIRDIQLAAAQSPNTPADALEKLAEDKNPDVRQAAAENPNTPWESVALALSKIPKDSYRVKKLDIKRAELDAMFKGEGWYKHSRKRELPHEQYETRTTYFYLTLAFIKKVLEIHNKHKDAILRRLQELNPELCQAYQEQSSKGWL